MLIGREVFGTSLGVVVLVVLVSMMLATGLTWGGETWIVPSDTNVSARVTRTWSSFPRVGAPGNFTFREPDHMAMDSKGRIFVLDFGLEPVDMVVLNQRMEVEEVVGTTKDCTVRIPMLGSYLSDVAVDSEDRIYISDSNRGYEYPGGPMLPGKVHVLHPNLSWLGSISIPYGEIPGGPSCIALDDRDRLIVGQFRALGNSRILVYAPDPNRTDVDDISMVLEKVFQLHPPDRERPNWHGDPIDVAVSPDGRLLIAESRTQTLDVERIVVLDRDFRWVDSYGSMGSKPGYFKQIYSVAVSPEGVIIAGDVAGGTISFFFPNGTFAGRIGELGKEPGQFRGIGDLMVMGRGELLVPEWKNRRIQRIVVDLSTLKPMKVVTEKLAVLITLSIIVLGAASMAKRS